MAKEELLEMRGKVVELLPNAMFRVELENQGADYLSLHAGTRWAWSGSGPAVSCVARE